MSLVSLVAQKGEVNAAVDDEVVSNTGVAEPEGSLADAAMTGRKKLTLFFFYKILTLNVPFYVKIEKVRTCVNISRNASLRNLLRDI